VLPRSLPFTFRPRALSGPRVVYVMVIHAGAALALLPEFFAMEAALAALALHFLTGCLGVSIGLHRALSHRSIFLHPYAERLFVFFAVLDIQKPITWVAVHRFHHKFSGTALDPHNAQEGFFWSHMGWLLRDAPEGFDPIEVAPDVAGDPFYRFLEQNFFLIFVGSLLALFFIGGWPFLIWAGFVRLVIVAHSTWATNSICHLLGYQNYPKADGFNVRIVSFFTYGEGLHNNHHGRQKDANFTARKGEVDLGWLVIQALVFLRLARTRQSGSSGAA
jgi:sn-1 stearoyl-lipid 9-desaturase